MNQNNTENTHSSVIKQLLHFFKYGKKFWITGVILFAVIVVLLILLTESSQVAPFIYSIF